MVSSFVILLLLLASGAAGRRFDAVGFNADSMDYSYHPNTVPSYHYYEYDEGGHLLEDVSAVSNFQSLTLFILLINCVITRPVVVRFE